mmetsp:Transcript_94465/g.264538  ORF Transcript_94465/g.264538 Transcript_94465/m.264538 type:complete len:119 (+) Transcript_94465:8-364(+)
MMLPKGKFVPYRQATAANKSRGPMYELITLSTIAANPSLEGGEGPPAVSKWAKSYDWNSVVVVVVVVVALLDEKDRSLGPRVKVRSSALNEFDTGKAVRVFELEKESLSLSFGLFVGE